MGSKVETSIYAQLSINTKDINIFVNVHLDSRKQKYAKSLQTRRTTGRRCLLIVLLAAAMCCCFHAQVERV